MSQLDQLPAGAVVRARPWDVVGAALAAPMVLWGFLDWFGTAGDSGGGTSGFFSGTGAAGLALVFAATAITINQILLGRAHQRSSPPLATLLSAAAVLIILGGMIAKPDSATIQAGSVAGLLTALTQAGALTVGWVTGSKKSVKAANLRALDAQQSAADLAAAGRYGSPYTGYGNGSSTGQYSQGYGQPQYGQPQYGQPQYGQPQYGQPQYGQPQYGQPQYGQPQNGQPQTGQPQYGQPQSRPSYPQGQSGLPGQYPYPAQSGYPPAGSRPGQPPYPPPR